MKIPLVIVIVCCVLSLWVGILWGETYAINHLFPQPTPTATSGCEYGPALGNSGECALEPQYAAPQPTSTEGELLCNDQQRADMEKRFPGSNIGECFIDNYGPQPTNTPSSPRPDPPSPPAYSCAGWITAYLIIGPTGYASLSDGDEQTFMWASTTTAQQAIDDTPEFKGDSVQQIGLCKHPNQ